MRRGRRLTSIIAIPLLIRLLIAGAGFPAAMTGGGSMDAAAMRGHPGLATHRGSAHAAMNDGRRTPTNDGTAPCCDVPCAPGCGLPGHCAAVIDCVIATAADAREPSSAGIPTVLANAPRSVTTGPEPPPPRTPTS